MAKYLLLTTAVLSLVLVGCTKKQPAVTPEPVSQGTPETGTVIDISERSGQEITTTPGDVLYLALKGTGGTNQQWTFVSPTSGSCLILKDQQIENLNEEKAEASFKWWLKVEETCRVDLQLNYGKSKQKPAQSFSATISSQ